MTNLEGKVALISGAARGQGRAHAVRLAQAGVDVIALDICHDIPSIDYPQATSGDLQETAAEIEAIGRRVVAVEADVRDVAAVRAAVLRGYTEFGRIDIVLSNAGVVRLGPNPIDPAPVWDDIIATNLTGGWNLTSAALPAMIESGRGGSIIFTGSTAGVRPTSNENIGPTAYSASKFGLVGLCKHLAATYAKDSIRVNIVHPTGVVSGMTVNDTMAELMVEAMNGGDNTISQMQNALPVMILEPGAISDTIMFLVSEQAQYITGVSLPVDAGFSIC